MRLFLKSAFLALSICQFDAFSNSLKTNIVHFQENSDRSQNVETRIDNISLFVVSSGQPIDNVYGTNLITGKHGKYLDNNNEIAIRAGREKTFSVYDEVHSHYGSNMSSFWIRLPGDPNPDKLNFFTTLDLHFYPKFIPFYEVICKDVSVAQSSFRSFNKDYNYWGLYYASQPNLNLKSNQILCEGKKSVADPNPAPIVVTINTQPVHVTGDFYNKFVLNFDPIPVK